MPDTAARTWPTVEEIAAVSTRLARGDGFYAPIEDLEVKLAPLVDLDVAPSIVDESNPPPLEIIGALSSTLAKVRFDLEHALGVVRTLEMQRDAMALEVDGAR